jgi:hypothetical protein
LQPIAYYYFLEEAQEDITIGRGGEGVSRRSKGRERKLMSEKERETESLERKRERELIRHD